MGHDARMRYEAHTGAMVAETGFVNHPTLAMCGGSVDGLVDEDGIIEIKAPTTPTHLKTILSDDCAYMEQIQGYLWLTGRQWCDYISFDPRPTDPALQFHMRRIARDEEFIVNLEIQVRKFLAEAAEIEAKLKDYDAEQAK